MDSSVISHVIMIPNDNWFLAIAIALSGGFVGGLAAALQEQLDASRAEKSSISGEIGKWRKSVEQVAGRSIVGAITGVGGLFIVLLSPITSSFGTGAFWAFLMGASTLFGIFATRILPALEKSFGRRLGIIEEEIVKVQGFESSLGIVEQEIGRVQTGLESNSGLDRAERALDDALSFWVVKSDVRKHALIADEYICKVPRTRRPNLRYARVHFEKLKDKGSAINALTRFISYLEKIPADKADPDVTIDLADALYNRACYYVNAPAEKGRPDPNYEPSSSELSLAIKDSSRAFQLNPDNIEDAEEDPYFNWIRQNSADFQNLLKRKGMAVSHPNPPSPL